jgi:Tol biopolymer transport system component
MIARVFVGAATLLAADCREGSRPLAPPSRFVASIPAGETLDSFAVSPDGNALVYSSEPASGRRRLLIRSLATDGEPDRELPGTAGATNPFFSPDARHVAYFARGGLWTIAADGGGEPQRIADVPGSAAGGTWTDGAQIVFAPLGGRGLLQVPAAGGRPVEVTRLNAAEKETGHGWPHALPGGAIVFTVSQRGRDAHLEVLSPARGRIRLRVPIAGPAQFVESGHLVYGYLGSLMAVRFSRESLEIADVPQPIAKGLNTFAVSRTGTLVWVRAGTEDARSYLVRVARDGTYQRLAAPAEVYQTPRLSPDGRRLAVVIRPDFLTREIRVIDAVRTERVLFTVSGGDNHSPAWMDGRRLTFGSNRDGLQKIYVTTGGGTPKPLFSADASAARNPAAWSVPPRLLALYEIEPALGRDVLIYRVGESITPAAATPANERSPVLSPDGRSVAFVSDRSGRDEIYLKTLDGSDEAVPLTSAGATEPAWTREGLFYREGDRMMRVEFKSGEPAQAGVVFEGDFQHDPGANLAAYDIDRRGNFIMLKSARASRELRVVRNWSTELIAQLPPRRF